MGAPIPATGPGPQSGGPAYDNPNLPQYGWPSYAQYPNYAAVTYPNQYSASVPGPTSDRSILIRRFP